MEYYDIWILRSERKVLLTDYPAPPLQLIVSSDGTLGGTYFDGECQVAFLGEFGDAYRIAKIAADVRGFSVDIEEMESWDDEPDEDVEGAEEWMETGDSDDEDLVGEQEEENA